MFHHDFPSWADGVLISYGIFDAKASLGHINLGLFRDTSEFACDSFKRFWNKYGRRRYPDASSILLTCDGGGSNSANKYIFKYDLERLSKSIGLPVRKEHHRSLSAVLLQVQSHRASSVPSPWPSLQRDAV